MPEASPLSTWSNWIWLLPFALQQAREARQPGRPQGSRSTGDEPNTLRRPHVPSSRRVLKLAPFLGGDPSPRRFVDSSIRVGVRATCVYQSVCQIEDPLPVNAGPRQWTPPLTFVISAAIPPDSSRDAGQQPIVARERAGPPRSPSIQPFGGCIQPSERTARRACCFVRSGGRVQPEITLVPTLTWRAFRDCLSRHDDCTRLQRFV